MTLFDHVASTPARRLLLYAARPFPGAAVREPLRALAARTENWDEVAALALQTKVLPMAWRTLRDAAGDLLPQAAQAHFRARYEANVRRNLSRTAELVQLARLFDAQHIAWLPFKGAVLAQTLYQDLGLRQYSDLDLLIAPPDLPAAAALLRARGYQLKEPQGLETPAHLAAFARTFYQHHLVFWHPHRHILLEVHWQFQKGILPPDEAFWSRLQTVPLAGCQVPALRPEERMLYLCQHGSHHQWQRLSWVCDVAAALHVYHDLDWHALWQRARQQGMARRLLLGAFMARELFDVPPPEVLRAPLARALRHLEPLARAARTFDAGDEDVAQRAYLRYQKMLRERRRDQIAYLWHYTFKPRPWAHDEALAEPWFFLHYLQRPWDVLKRRLQER